MKFLGGLESTHRGKLIGISLKVIELVTSSKEYRAKVNKPILCLLLTMRAKYCYSIIIKT